MNNSWFSNGVFNYVYKKLTGDDWSPRPPNSMETLSKGVWINDLPTNDYGPIELSHGARVMASKHKREANIEAKIVNLKEGCNERVRKLENVNNSLKGEVVRLKCLLGQRNYCCQQQAHEIIELRKVVKSLGDELESKTTELRQMENNLRNSLGLRQVEMTRERSFKAERQICQMTSEIESYKEKTRSLEAQNMYLKKKLTDLQHSMDARDITECREPSLQTSKQQQAFLDSFSLDSGNTQSSHARAELNTTKATADERPVIQKNMTKNLHREVIPTHRLKVATQETANSMNSISVVIDIDDDIPKKTEERQGIQGFLYRKLTRWFGRSVLSSKTQHV